MPKYRVNMDIEVAYRLNEATLRIRDSLEKATGAQVRMITCASLDGPAFEIEATASQMEDFKRREPNKAARVEGPC